MSESFDIPRTDMPEIDCQHEQLGDILHRLASSIEDVDLFRALLEEFKRQAKAHFVYENELMYQYGYPNLEPGKREHDHMEERFVEALVELEKGLITTPRFVSGIASWFITHTKEHDLLLGQHVMDLRNKYSQKT